MSSIRAIADDTEHPIPKDIWRQHPAKVWKFLIGIVNFDRRLEVLYELLLREERLASEEWVKQPVIEESLLAIKLLKS